MNEQLYRTMRLIRRFEERIVDLVNANEIAGVTHEYVGQEAVATGVCAALGPADVITSTHRGHGHVIAKGADVRRMMAELLGRVDGLNRVGRNWTGKPILSAAQIEDIVAYLATLRD